MGSDSFTRGGKSILSHIGSTDEPSIPAPQLPTEIKVGKKEKTGSTIENPATIVFTAPLASYSTEMYSAYPGPIPDSLHNHDVKKIDRSGYSLNNRFKPKNKVIDEVYSVILFIQ